MMQQINYPKPAVENLGRESHPWRRCLGCLALGLLILSGQSTQVFGQLAEPDTVPVENGKQLDASKLVGSEQITEGRVTATISFLASDELGGRETNSKEFEIATAYVASRFRGAGLEGGGKDGSYFHETLVPQYRVPESVVFTGASRSETQSEPNSSSNPTQNATGKPTEKSDRAPIAHYGLLNAGEQAVEIEGVATDVSLDAFQAPEAKIPPLAGIIRGRFETTAKGSRALSQLTRLATRLKEAGAVALLLECDPESEWYKQAELARMKPRIEKMGGGDLPILLISNATSTSGTLQLKVPAMQREEKKMRNVVGLLRGTDPELSQQAVLFSAHLDHLGSNPKLPGDGIFNGADDDATGVTAVLTLADAIGAMTQRPKRSVLFMTFWGEESGLLGSRQFVSTPSWPLEKITANINIEMIGRPEGGANGKIWMTGWRESDLGVLMSEAAKPYGCEIFEHPKFSAMLYRASDNWSFVEKGVVAHSFSAGSLHSDYHKVTDEWERLEIPHMTKVIRGLWVGAMPLLDGSRSPAKPQATEK